MAVLGMILLPSTADAATDFSYAGSACADPGFRDPPPRVCVPSLTRVCGCVRDPAQQGAPASLGAPDGGSDNCTAAENSTAASEVPPTRWPLLTPENSSEVVRLPVPSLEGVCAGVCGGAHAYTCVAPQLQAGHLNWHDPATWPDGRVPLSAGVNVTLPPNTSVLLSSCSLPPGLVLGHVIIPEGSALVLADADMNISAAGFTVAGNMTIGTERCRLASHVTITLVGSRPTDPSTPRPAWVKGISVTGTLDVHGALYAHTWSRIAATVIPGDEWVLAQLPVNWEPGQRLVLTSTAFKDARDYHENEVRIIAAVIPLLHGTAIRVTQPFERMHYAGQEYQAEVALLSRRLIVQGDASDSEPADAGGSPCSDTWFSSFPCPNANLTGYGGHIMVHGQAATGRLSGVLLHRMGQTNILARYPAHFHMVAESGNRSFVQDSTIWRSYYRCVSVHGTHGMRLSRNVAFDATGHCYYLEDGVEERNIFEFNLASLVHVVGYAASQANASGQGMTDFVQTASLVLPADVTASGFYITNSYNSFRGNAASGGWAGFAFPNLPAPIGLHRNVSMVPQSRPTLVFEGNTAHSSGYYWNQAACIYVGGVLQYVNAASNILTYNPGRNVAGRSTENGGFMQFNNTKVALCNVGLMHWGQREEIVNFEAHDVMRSMTIFGNAYVTRMLATCRTSNVPSVPGTRWTEGLFRASNVTLFQWYDTGQSHIVTNSTIRNCSSTRSRRFRAFELMTHSDQFLPDNMQATRNIRFESSTANTRVGMSVPAPTSTSGRLQNWLDLDGSISGTGVPTLLGSVLANVWWRLDASCVRADDWMVWLCRRTPGRGVSSIVMRFDPDQSFVGGRNCSNGDFKPCAAIGYVAHIGYTTPETSLPLTLPGRITGPSGGFGWYISVARGAPKLIEIDSIQVTRDEPLVVAFPYPAGTTFNISMRITGTCQSWCQPQNRCLCRWYFRPVASAAAVRDGAGDTYFFDGATLYVKPTAHRNWNVGIDGRWNATYAAAFEREGVAIPARGGAVLVIEAACNASEPGGVYCAVNASVPAAPCPAGQKVQAFDACPSPSPSPTPSSTPSASISTSPSTSSSASRSWSASPSQSSTPTPSSSGPASSSRTQSPTSTTTTSLTASVSVQTPSSTASFQPRASDSGTANPAPTTSRTAPASSSATESLIAPTASATNTRSTPSGGFGAVLRLVPATSISDALVHTICAAVANATGLQQDSIVIVPSFRHAVAGSLALRILGGTLDEGFRSVVQNALHAGLGLGHAHHVVVTIPGTRARRLLSAGMDRYLVADIVVPFVVTGVSDVAECEQLASEVAGSNASYVVAAATGAGVVLEHATYSGTTSMTDVDLRVGVQSTSIPSAVSSFTAAMQTGALHASILQSGSLAPTTVLQLVGAPTVFGASPSPQRSNSVSLSTLAAVLVPVVALCGAGVAYVLWRRSLQSHACPVSQSAKVHDVTSLTSSYVNPSFNSERRTRVARVLTAGSRI